MSFEPLLRLRSKVRGGVIDSLKEGQQQLDNTIQDLRQEFKATTANLTSLITKVFQAMPQQNLVSPQQTLTYTTEAMRQYGTPTHQVSPVGNRWGANSQQPGQHQLNQLEFKDTATQAKEVAEATAAMDKEMTQHPTLFNGDNMIHTGGSGHQ